ncbi:ATP-binding protein, partial [Candidatus Dojkabacteria bacterium]|nr:ATP-binding protein [Candidatus Dojkabacteria bacterium]
GQIYAQYPNAEIQEVADYTKTPAPEKLLSGEPYKAFVTTGEVELEKDYIFPIKTFRSFDVDPLAAITSAMAELKEGQSVWVQILVRPIANYWQDASKDYITAIKEGRTPGGTSLLNKFVEDMGKTLSNLGSTPSEAAKKEVVKLVPGQDEELRQIEEKMLKPGFELKIRLVTKAQDQFTSEQLLRDIVASFKQFTTSHLNNFVHSNPEKGGEEIYKEYLDRHLPAEPIDIVNIEELASIFHLPNNSVETPTINWSRARKAEPPMNLPVSIDDDITFFGETDYRGDRYAFGIKRIDRRRHMYLLGKTGVGKSSTFKNMFVADVLKGDGACYIDPHGQDLEELLDYIPENRIDDVIYFDPSDSNYPVGFNLLELDELNQRDLVADGVVAVFKKEFGNSWGPRLQYILQNAVSTCLEAQGTTLLAVQRILVDSNFRKFILKQVKDPVLLKFWNEEYAQMSQNSKLITEAVAPIQNKVGRFISSAVIRNIVGQVKSTINLREAMDNKKILMVNLAQGKIGEESASLLGGLLITRLQAAALQRVDTPEDERNDFFLYVDEFQNFATDSFAKILSEARKFRLNLTMTNQYIEQIPLTVRNAIFGNVGTLASFVVSQADAGILGHEFSPIFDQDDLVSLESHSMYVKLCIDGMTSKPFSAKSLDYRTRLQKFGLKEQVVQSSRTKYGTSREEIEDKIRRWSEQTYSDKGNRSMNAKERKLQEKPNESSGKAKSPRIEKL